MRRDWIASFPVDEFGGFAILPACASDFAGATEHDTLTPSKHVAKRKEHTVSIVRRELFRLSL
jgi:hypothetical protein